MTQIAATVREEQQRPTQRERVLEQLYYFTAYRASEIAASTGIPVASVRRVLGELKRDHEVEPVSDWERGRGYVKTIKDVMS